MMNLPALDPFPAVIMDSNTDEIQSLILKIEENGLVWSGFFGLSKTNRFDFDFSKF
jgi:hypothetical protein